MSFTITHPNKLFFPKDNITKQDLVNYYQKVAPLFLPHVKNRPLILQRFPNGILKKGFFQKNVSSYFPSWISTVEVQRKTQADTELILCQNKKTLLYLVNQGTITFHTWLSKKGKLQNPDQMIFDIDPPKGMLKEAKLAVQKLRAFLEKKKSYLMTTGSRGFHVIVPLAPKRPFKEVKKEAKSLSEALCKEYPKLFTTKLRKKERKGKIFIDYLRNEYAQHSVAPYSVRPLPKAPIAMPISWDDLSRINPQSINLSNFTKYIRQDPWKGL